MNQYTKLASSAVEHYVKNGQSLPLPVYLDPVLTRQSACFIHLHTKPGRRLRASYGQPFPRQPSLAQEIIINATYAVAQITTRPLNRAELNSLLYTVATLDPMQRISHPTQLEPRQYGLYVRSDQGKAALILPQRHGIATGQDQIATAIREAGIDTKQEATTMYRFNVAFYE